VEAPFKPVLMDSSESDLEKSPELVMSKIKEKILSLICGRKINEFPRGLFK